MKANFPCPGLEIRSASARKLSAGVPIWQVIHPPTVVRSRLRSETGEGDEGPIGLFMPMIDMFNHHPHEHIARLSVATTPHREVPLSTSFGGMHPCMQPC